MRYTSAAASILLGLSCLVGCEASSDGPLPGTSRGSAGGLFSPLTEDQRRALEVQLATAEARWTNGGPTEYRLVLDHWTLGYVSRAELTVDGDSIVSIEGLPNDRGEPPLLHPALWPTIAGLFDEIRSAVRDAVSVVVEFDTVLGYPRYFQVDYSARIRDDEGWFHVRELEPQSGGR